MRRHHFLSLHALEAPADSASQDIKSIPKESRNRVSQPDSQEAMHRKLPRLFIDQPFGNENTIGGEHTPRSDQTGDSEPDNAAASPGFLGREISVTSVSSMSSYSRLMHARTKSQMDTPSGGTIPTYAKTMHAHTLGQLNKHRGASRSAANSPSFAGSAAIEPANGLLGRVTKLSLDDHGMVPHAPVNTPENPFGKLEAVVGVDFGKMRRRSLTTPSAARDFAIVEARDFAAGAVGF